MMVVIIDRFEGEFAVVELPETCETVNIPRVLVPDAQEGDVVIITVGKDNERKKRIDKLADELFK